MPRHIPEPPPVQKRTFPLKISGLKTAVESTIGTSYGEGDMARELEARQHQQLLQRKHRLLVRPLAKSGPIDQYVR